MDMSGSFIQTNIGSKMVIIKKLENLPQTGITTLSILKVKALNLANPGPLYITETERSVIASPRQK